MSRFSSILVLPPLLAALAACGAPQDRYGAAVTAAAASQRAAALSAADWSKAEAVTVTLDEFSFAPDALTFQGGRTYRLTVVNEGGSDHTFTAPEFFRAVAVRAPDSGAQAAAALESIAVGAGASRTVEFVAVSPGEYKLECERPLHSIFGMHGTMTIE